MTDSLTKEQQALLGLIEEARHLLEESRPANGLDQSEQDAWAKWRADWLEKVDTL